MALVGLGGFTAGGPWSLCAQDAPFRRGDFNIDGQLDVSDAVAIVRVLFLGEPSPGCDDAADADDDGRIIVTDCIRVMRFLFLDGSPPPSPFTECGSDPTPDALGCDAFEPCDDGGLCLDQETLDGLLSESVSFSFCLPAGIVQYATDALAISLCPAEEAAPCGIAQLPGCPLDVTSITATVDVPGRRVVVRFEGRVDGWPLRVTETVFNTTSTCTLSVGGAGGADPFSFEAILPLETVEVRPGVEEISGVGQGGVENVDMRLTATGGLICLLFQAGQGAFVDLIVSQLDTLTGAVGEGLGDALVGLRLCEG